MVKLQLLIEYIAIPGDVDMSIQGYIKSGEVWKDSLGIPIQYIYIYIYIYLFILFICLKTS